MRHSNHIYSNVSQLPLETNDHSYDADSKPYIAYLRSHQQVIIICNCFDVFSELDRIYHQPADDVTSGRQRSTDISFDSMRLIAQRQVSQISIT